MRQVLAAWECALLGAQTQTSNWAQRHKGMLGTARATLNTFFLFFFFFLLLLFLFGEPPDSPGWVRVPL